MLTKQQLQRAIQSRDPDVRRLAVEYLDLVSTPYYRFRPRFDRPEDLDQQASFVADQFDGVACVLGGTGSGKSSAAAWKVAHFLKTTPPPRPNTPYWVVSQTLEMAAGNGWGKNLSQFFDADDIQDTVWYSKARRLPRAVVLKSHANGNNWSVEFHSYDMDRKALQAFSLGGWWCDELCPYSILMELWMRCRDYAFPGSMLYTLTPILDGARGYDTRELEEIFKDRHNRKDWRFYRLNSLLNTALAPGFIERAVGNEVEELRETRLTGAFCSLSGAIYKQFGDDHICKPFPVPDDWYHIRAIDFGWSHETAVVWAARDHAGRYYVYHEYSRQKALLRDHLDAILEVPWGTDRQYWGDTWADYAAAQERRELSQMGGFETSSAKKHVLPGIGCVQRLLRDKKLFLFDSCKQLIRQMHTYRWSPSVKDKVDKQDDDLVDSLRYLVFSDQCDYVEPKVESEEDRTKRLLLAD